jgi:hypothetical protein
VKFWNDAWILPVEPSQESNGETANCQELIDLAAQLFVEATPKKY